MDARSIVESTRDRLNGVGDSKRKLISVICSREIKDAILMDIKNEIYAEELKEVSYLVFKGNTFYKGKDEMEDKLEEKEEGKNLYSAVHVIVEKGYSEDVIIISEKIGAKGATVIPAEGNKFAKKYIAPGLNINPLKEIVLIITSREKGRELMEILNNNEVITGKGKGIAYLIDIDEFSGF